MMGNRKQPFGYKMALGEIVIQEAEARLVQGIFRRYIAGESLNELTEALRQQDIPYDEGRLWNKNMVARILADIRYTGEKGYPKLIDEEQLIAANEKRSNKPQLPKKTEAQKVLRRLCGTPPSEQVEQSVTYLLNGLANYPDRIQHRRSPTPVTYSKTQEALDNTLEQQPIDEDSAKVLILRLAAEQYAALGNEEYETNRLRRLFSAFECVAELNADLLKSTVRSIGRWTMLSRTALPPALPSRGAATTRRTDSRTSYKMYKREQNITTGCSATIMTTKPLMKSTSCCGSRSCRYYKTRPQRKEQQICRFFLCGLD